MIRGVEPLFGQFEHDRAAEHRSDEKWLAEAWRRGQVVVVTPAGEAPIEDGPDGPRVQWRPAADVPDDAPRVFLGVLGESPMFCVRGPRDSASHRWSDLRNIGERLPVADRGLLVEAVAVCQWHERHSKCPVCGADTVPREAGWSTRCPVDDTTHFPRTDPAVIMLVHDGADRCVLGRQPIWPEGRFSVLAGFVEPGESLEAAVAREVREEVGLRVVDIGYVGSQPWPFPASIMLGFIARVDGSEDILPADGEIAEAYWFTRDEVNGLFGWADAQASAPGARSMPGQISIAHHMIKAWAEGRFAELLTADAAASSASDPDQLLRTDPGGPSGVAEPVAHGNRAEPVTHDDPAGSETHSELPEVVVQDQPAEPQPEPVRRRQPWDLDEPATEPVVRPSSPEPGKRPWEL